MNDSILKDVVAKLSVDQPLAIIFQDGEVHFPVIKRRKPNEGLAHTLQLPSSDHFSYDTYPRCRTAPHVEVVKRPKFQAYVSQTDLSSVDRKFCIAVIIYGQEDSVACMTKDENYAHGFGFGSTEKAFYLLEKAEA